MLERVFLVFPAEEVFDKKMPVSLVLKNSQYGNNENNH